MVERDDYLTLAAAEKDRALILWGYDGLGTFATIPLEARCKIYERAFSQQCLWQCYHTKRPDLGLLGITHSSPLPAIFRVSNAVRDGLLDSVWREQAAQIIIGTEVISFNFPAMVGMEEGQAADAAHTKLPTCKELFIGIQVPAQRDVTDAAAVRSNVERVVDLLNGIAAKHPLPRIRATFHTNAETRGRR